MEPIESKYFIRCCSCKTTSTHVPTFKEVVPQARADGFRLDKEENKWFCKKCKRKTNTRP